MVPKIILRLFLLKKGENKMNEIIGKLYSALRLANPDDSLDSFKNKIIAEVNDELHQSIEKNNFDNGEYKVHGKFDNSFDPLAAIQQLNEYVNALDELFGKLSWILENSIILDDFDINPFVVDFHDNSLIDITSTEKVNALVDYLKTFEEKDDVTKSVESPSELLKAVVSASDIESFGNELNLFDGETLYVDGETDVDTLYVDGETDVDPLYANSEKDCFAFLDTQREKLYISNTLLDRFIVTREKKLEALCFRKIKKRKFLCEYLPIIIIGTLFVGLAILFGKKEVYFTNFRWYYWLGYIPLVIIAAPILLNILLRIITKIRKPLTFTNVREPTGLKSFLLPSALGTLLSLMILMILWLWCKSFLLLVFSLSLMVVFYIEGLLCNPMCPETPFRETGIVAIRFSIISMITPIILYLFHESSACLITMFALYILPAGFTWFLNEKFEEYED